MISRRLARHVSRYLPLICACRLSTLRRASLKSFRGSLNLTLCPVLGTALIQRESEIITASLTEAPREQTRVLPFLDQSKKKTRSPLNSAILLGGPPASGCTQIVEMPPPLTGYAMPLPSGVQRNSVGDIPAGDSNDSAGLFPSIGIIAITAGEFRCSSQ